LIVKLVCVSETGSKITLWEGETKYVIKPGDKVVVDDAIEAVVRQVVVTGAVVLDKNAEYTVYLEPRQFRDIDKVGKAVSLEKAVVIARMAYRCLTCKGTRRAFVGFEQQESSCFVCEGNGFDKDIARELNNVYGVSNL